MKKKVVKLIEKYRYRKAIFLGKWKEHMVYELVYPDTCYTGYPQYILLKNNKIYNVESVQECLEIMDYFKF